ncbi:PREDICTED: synaptonemal complex central element protein 1 isoform X2 [Chinchilla lanigera]|uniref:synaptonemal complex central element protein 1 isoform X2 n=1 Tax=Chinchilla lanigera TaxID=34839 RepID=UPI00038ECD70|nr:PREDICTED: synaptonemal complex central element protein 1 isoform X2 [Chinchilla lanigera]
MAARAGPSTEEPAGPAEPAKGVEGAKGQDTSTQKIEDLMEIVKKLQKGNLEPRIEVLINRINEVQQAKKKAIEELGEARNIWDALQKELDSLREEKVHLKEILNKKQETLKILQLHCQEKETEAQRKETLLQECKERITSLNLQIEEEKSKQRQLRLDFEEQLETLTEQHKDLWEFHRPEQLEREICALDSNKEQLLKEEKLVEEKLEDVKHQLCSLRGSEGSPTLTEGLFLRSQEAAAAVQLFREENRKAEELLEAAAQHHRQLKQRCEQLQEKRQRLKEELEKYGVQAQGMQEEGAGPHGLASPRVLAVFEEKDPELPTKEGLIPS